MTRDQYFAAARDVLRRIELGHVSVRLVEGDLLIGKVEYQTGDGWTIVVFSDGDAWDYIDSMIAPTGEQFPLWPESAEQDSEAMAKLRSYHPPGDQAQTIWGFLA